MKFILLIFRILFTLITFCCGFFIHSCIQPSEATVPRQFHSWTADAILTDSVRYLIDRSPLKGIKGYERFFFLGEEHFFYTIEPQEGSRADMLLMVRGEWEKEYAAVWKLADSLLYLTGLDPLSNRMGFQNLSEDIPRMKEILTERSLIDKNIPSDSTPIPCTWVTGTYYVKKGNEHYGYIRADFERAPFYELVFESGKLISVRPIETMPQTEEDKTIYERQLRRFFKSRKSLGKIRQRKLEERIKKTDEENRKKLDSIKKKYRESLR